MRTGKKTGGLRAGAGPTTGAVAVQKQVRLPLAKAVEIAFRSLRVRLGRSILTLITIIMAMAFLTEVWTSSTIEPVIHNAVLQSQHLPPVATGGAARVVWLLSLSLLVCLVGISNAMLMSVMERFREIGTMKCLGALDSFILKLFLLESLFLGAVGTVTGVGMGLALAVGIVLVRYGAAGLRYLPWPEIPLILGCSLAIGVLITAAAALYPAWKAARMDPINAMRVEV